MKLLGWLFILSAVQGIESTGVLKLKMKSFNNPMHITRRRRCRDTVMSYHKNPCDNFFKNICLTAPRAVACGLGRIASGVIRGNSDSISFGSTNGSVSNPIMFSFRRWEGSFKLKIKIWDKDRQRWRGKGDLILSGEKNIKILASREGNSTATEVHFTNRISKLVLEVRVHCDKGYLPPSCEEYCSPSSDSNRRYTCDFVNGKKVCFDHWYGDNCSKPCLARDDDMGHYICDNRTGEIICMPGWRNESTNCTDGSTSLVHRSVIGLDEVRKPSFALKTAVLNVLPTTSLNGSVPVYKNVTLHTNISLENIESFASVAPENSNISLTNLHSISSSAHSFAIGKSQGIYYKMGSATVDINIKHADIHYQTTKSISNEADSASTFFKVVSTDYSSKISTRLNYKTSTESRTLEVRNSNHKKKATSSCCVKQSTSLNMGTTSYVVSMPAQPKLSVMQTKWPIGQSTESLEIMKVSESKTLERSLSKSESSNVESQEATHSMTATLYMSTKSSKATLDFKDINTASSSDYSPQSSLLEYRYKLEEFRFMMHIELGENQLAKSFEDTLKKEICRSIKKLCEYSFGCSKSNTGLHPELKARKKKKQCKRVTARLKFREFVRADDRQDAENSLLKAVLDASRKIEASLSLRVTKVVIVKGNEGKSKEDTLPDLKKDSPDFRDATKLLLPIVIGNLVFITILLLVVKLLWHRKVTKKVRPSPLSKVGDTAGNRRIHRTKEVDIRGHMNKNRKDMMGMQNEMNFKTPKMSGNYTKQIQVDIEDKHLETVFL